MQPDNIPNQFSPLSLRDMRSPIVYGDPGWLQWQVRILSSATNMKTGGPTAPR
jgi:hypothetical protein